MWSARISIWGARGARVDTGQAARKRRESSDLTHRASARETENSAREESFVSGPSADGRLRLRRGRVLRARVEAGTVTRWVGCVGTSAHAHMHGACISAIPFSFYISFRVPLFLFL